MGTQYSKYRGVQNKIENSRGKGKPTIYKYDWRRQEVPMARQMLTVIFPNDHDPTLKQHSVSSP